MELFPPGLHSQRQCMQPLDVTDKPYNRAFHHPSARHVAYPVYVGTEVCQMEQIPPRSEAADRHLSRERAHWLGFLPPCQPLAGFSGSHPLPRHPSRSRTGRFCCSHPASERHTRQKTGKKKETLTTRHFPRRVLSVPQRGRPENSTSTTFCGVHPTRRTPLGLFVPGFAHVVLTCCGLFSSGKNSC